MRLLSALLLFLSLLVASPRPVDAQIPSSGSRPQATAVRVPPGATIRLDGLLDEQAWREAPPITDFVQKEPNEGAPPTERIEVRFLYDDSGIFVGARMSSRAGPAAIQAPLGRRDEVDQAEYVLVALDTYLDRRTAYCFGVTASGVRLDHYHATDAETEADSGFDPVWQARTRIDEQGWTAELWIPFSQLRFSQAPRQVWGLNVHRRTPTYNEDDYWVAVPRTERAWASRFGELRGIEGIRPSRRIELLPYFSTRSTITGRPDRQNPFDDGVNLASGTGLDLKLGVGPNLTLDATVNPDFAQVEADPAEVNLSNLETIFDERRPFFTEGSGLFAGGANNYFYSRRIGAVPVGSPPGGYVEHPPDATILAAAKLTGRLPSGLSVGLLGALTGGEHARTFDAGLGTVARVAVAPRSQWGVARLQQEFGAAASTAGLMFTAVHRELPAGGALAALLPRNAFSLSADSLLRLKGGEYEIAMDAGVTHVDGDAAAMALVQQASPRYFQRPDATHVNFDPTRTSLNGGRADLTVQRRSGRHWLWVAALRVESPELEHNDIGRLGSGDGIQLRQASLTFRETQPGMVFRNYRLTANTIHEWTFGGQHSTSRVEAEFQGTWRNFWTTTVGGSLNLRAQNWQLTRGGPLMETPRGWAWRGTLANRSVAQTLWSGTAQYEYDEFGGLTRGLDGQLSWRPRPSWQLATGAAYRREINSRQYVTTRADGGPATYDGRYIFSFIDRSTISAQFRLSYTFKPDLTLDVYAEPFAASGRYYDFGELSAARSRLLRDYGTDGTAVEAVADGSRAVRDGADSFVITNRDFNTRSFRSNVVLHWEWRPGSAFYVVWQQDRAHSELSGARATLGDLVGSLGVPGHNIVAVKVSFWIAH